jgi:hypothetical protein
MRFEFSYLQGEPSLIIYHSQESCAAKLLHPRKEFPKSGDARLEEKDQCMDSTY